MSIVPLWVKLVAAAVVAAALFGAGWTTKGWKDDAAQKAVAEAQVAEQQRQATAAALDRAEQDAAAQNDRNDYNANRLALERKTQDLEDKVHAQAVLLDILQARPNEPLRADEPFNRHFVRDWNAPIRLLYDAVGDTSLGPDLLPDDTVAARVTREDVLVNHGRIVAALRDCKVKQQKVLEYDTRLGAWLRSKEGVPQ